MEEEYEDLKDAISKLYDLTESTDFDEEEAEAKYYELEQKLEEFEANNYDEIDLEQVKKWMRHVKKELDLYDAEGELDSMYPNRHDPDFDEDDISGESFFKD